VRIAYVLPSPELNGGNKVIFQHVGLLRSMGDEVTVLAEGPKPGWIEIDARYVDTTAEPTRLADQDLVVATYWTTVERALALEAGPVAHFCQGYEGALPHLREMRSEVDRVYSLPVPTLAVSPHLVPLLRDRFGRESRVAPPPLDPAFRPAARLRPDPRPWIAVPGIFESEVKGVATALAAVERLRARGVPARLLRVSTWPLGDEERALCPSERYLCGVPPETVADELRRCDLLILASREEEGFGLPLLEAMASKVPGVASRIPSIVAFAADAAALVPAGEPEAFAGAAHELLTRPRAWRRARQAGWAAAQRFAPQAVGPHLREAVRWASRQAAGSPARAGAAAGRSHSAAAS